MNAYQRRELAIKKYNERLEKNYQYYLNNKEKYEAHLLAKSTLSLEGKSCIMCGSTENLRRHHRDYNYPLMIDVVCQGCHNIIHQGKHDEFKIKKAVELGLLKPFTETVSPYIFISPFEQL